jgi:hypothetical protein
MTNWKLRLAEPLLLGAALALALFLVASQTAANDWVQPAFVVPFLGAALLSGNMHSPASWLIGALLVLQCYLVVLFAGWVLGRYRSRSPKA